MDVELTTMGFLMSGPRTGYELKNIAGKFLLTYNLSLNQIYPTLRKFEEAGFVNKEVVVQTNKPNKHIYTITKKGREHFIKWITAPPKPLEYSIDFLNRLTFFRFLDKDQIKIEFEKEIQNIEETLGDLDNLEKTVNKQADEHGRFIYRTAIMLFESMRNAYAEQLAEISSA